MQTQEIMVLQLELRPGFGLGPFSLGKILIEIILIHGFGFNVLLT